MVNKENYEEYMLLYADGELKDGEVKALLAFVDAHPELRNELDAYTATRLVPDTAVVYTHKEQLMKSSGGGRTIALGKWWMYAAAACVLLFAIIMINNKGTNPTPLTAIAEPIKQMQPIMDTPKELHLKPENPVIHENTIAASKVTTKKRKSIPAASNITIAQKNESQTIEMNNPSIPKTETPEPVIAINEPQMEQVIEQTTSTAPSAAIVQNTEEKKNLFDRLPLTKNKTEGIAAVTEAVNTKIEKIKELKTALKDSEVKFRIGNKELFALKF